MHSVRAVASVGRCRFASSLRCVAAVSTSSTMQQQQQQRQPQQQQGQGGNSGNRKRRGGKHGDSKGPGYAAPSSATPGHLGGGRPQQQRQVPAQGNQHHQQHQHTMQHTPTHQHQHVHPMPHAREPHVNRGQMQMGQHMHQQQQHAAGHHHRVQDNGVQANTSALSGVMFSSLNLHPATLSGLHDVFGYEEMFKVQAAACPPAMEGYDVLAKAKTGTGKTLAFLIPIAEHLVDSATPPIGGAIRALVLAPTRELTAQIKAEAVKLLTPHGNTLGVQMVIGGTNINRERSGLTSSRCDLLIATPGRLTDHLDSTPGFAGRLWGVQVLVMDEADRLLDMGFRPAIEAIMRYLPPASQRQSLMFSATIPKGVSEVAAMLLRDNYVTVNTVSDDERPSHEAITQEYLLTPPDQLMQVLMGVIKAHMAAEPDSFKVIVFFPTARAAQFHAALARASGCEAYDLHSRLSQKQRDTASAAFGKSPTAVMFASDVIARGLDFPDVSLVVQVGLTDATQYEHRVGRTGRAGKDGEALLLLADDESRLLPTLKDFPLQPAGAAGKPTAAGRVAAAAQQQQQYGGDGYGSSGRGLVTAAQLGQWRWDGLSQGLAAVGRDDALLKSGEQAFVATLGFLAGKLKALGWDKVELVEQTKARFSGLGLPKPPAIEARTLGKMNLKGVPGIEIAPPQQRQGNKPKPAAAAMNGAGGGGGGEGGGGGRGGGGGGQQQQRQQQQGGRGQGGGAAAAGGGGGAQGPGAGVARGGAGRGRGRAGRGLGRGGPYSR